MGHLVTGWPVPSGVCTCHACTCEGCHRCDGPADRIPAATLRQWAEQTKQERQHEEDQVEPHPPLAPRREPSTARDSLGSGPASQVPSTQRYDDGLPSPDVTGTDDRTGDSR